MGCVNRPLFSSEWSSHCCSSVIECCWKKSASTLLLVASHAIAFTPFSQKSTLPALGESPHAQPGQSKPPGWFARNNALTFLAAFSLLIKCLAELLSAPQPPAGEVYAGEDFVGFDMLILIWVLR